MYGSWIYNYLCNQCPSPLMLWIRISIRASCTTLCDKVYQWLATGQWFSPGPPVSSTNKTDHYDITEILLKLALNTIKQTNNFSFSKLTNVVQTKHINNPCFTARFLPLLPFTNSISIIFSAGALKRLTYYNKKHEIKSQIRSWSFKIISFNILFLLFFF